MAKDAKVTPDDRKSDGSVGTSATERNSATGKDIVPPPPRPDAKRVGPKIKKEPCICCRKKLRIIYFLAVGFAFGVGTYYYTQHIQRAGFPITQESNFAAKRFLLTCGMVAFLAVSGFIILVCGVSSMFIGILYMFLATAALYYCVITISTAAYSQKTDKFENIVDHSRTYYNRLGKFPLFIDAIQQSDKCCGYGEIFTNSWPTLINRPDLPDSCCIVPTIGCGKNLVPRISSGTLYSFEFPYWQAYIYNNTIKSKDGVGEYVTAPEDCAKEIIGEKDLDEARAENYAGVPDEILRRIDLHFARPSQRYVPPPLCPIWTYNNEIDIFVYRSRGIEELRRLRSVIFTESCEPESEDPDPSDPFKDYNARFLGATRKQMKLVVLFSSILCLLCILMSILFWYYYSKIKAKEMNEQLTTLRDFQELDIEATDFGGEGGANEENPATDLEKEEKRKRKLERHANAHHHRRRSTLKGAATISGLSDAKDKGGKKKKKKKSRKDKATDDETSKGPGKDDKTKGSSRGKSKGKSAGSKSKKKE